MQRPEFVNVSSKNVDTINDVKNSKVIGAQINSTLRDLIQNLVSNKISKNFVFDNGKPVGIITDKDIIRFLYIDKSASQLE